MESSCIQIPHSKTGGHAFPSLEVARKLHGDVKHIQFAVSIWNEVILVCAWCFGMI